MRSAKKLDARQLSDYAVRLLAARNCSVSELRRRLSARAQEEGDVEPLLARLAEYGYLSDRRFAETYASARLSNQGLGRRRVLADLRRKQVESGAAEESVSAVYAETDEEALIINYLERRFRASDLAEKLADPKGLGRVLGRLIRAGFSPGLAAAVLRRMSTRPELLDGMDEDDAELQ